MLLGRAAERKLHDEIILELRFPYDVHFAFSFREYGKVGFVILVVVFDQESLEILHNGLWVLSELDVELLDFFDPAKVHIIAAELKIELEFAITGQLNANKPEILRVALNGDFDE